MEKIWCVTIETQLVSWNVLMRAHRMVQHQINHDIHLLVRTMLDPELPMIPTPCQVDATCWTALDVDNVAIKPYIDALKGWWWKNDNRFHIQKLHVEVLPRKRAELDVVMIQAFPITDGPYFTCPECDQSFCFPEGLRKHKCLEKESET